MKTAEEMRANTKAVLDAENSCMPIAEDYLQTVLYRAGLASDGGRYYTILSGKWTRTEVESLAVDLEKLDFYIEILPQLSGEDQLYVEWQG